MKGEASLTQGSQAAALGVSIAHLVALEHRFIFGIILNLWESCRVGQRIPIHSSETLHYLPQVSVSLLHLLSCLEAVTWGSREQGAEVDGLTHPGMSCPDAES